MAKASIHILPVKTTSEIHNKRLKDYDYVRKELSHLNESWEIENISSARKRIEENYQKSTGQKMQKKATPIREGVVNLNPEHTMQDLFRLKEELEKKLGIKTIQIHIHRDEGHYRSKASSENWKPNFHAHMVFDWTDEKGKSLRLNRNHMSKIQDIVAETLSMERGQRATITGAKHLNPLEYKIQKITENINEKSQELEEQLKELHKIKSIHELGEKELKHINVELEQKRLKFQQFFQNDINVKDFIKSVPNRFFGTKNEINEEEIKNLIQSFSFSTEENKMLNRRVQELEKQKEEKINQINQLTKEVQVLKNHYNNPDEEYLKTKLSAIENRRKAKKEEERQRAEHKGKLKELSNLAIHWAIKDAQENGTRLELSDITGYGIELGGMFKEALRKTNTPNVWSSIEIEDEILNQLEENFEINLRNGRGVRFR